MSNFIQIKNIRVDATLNELPYKINLNDYIELKNPKFYLNHNYSLYILLDSNEEAQSLKSEIQRYEPFNNEIFSYRDDYSGELKQGTIEDLAADRHIKEWQKEREELLVNGDIKLTGPFMTDTIDS